MDFYYYVLTTEWREAACAHATLAKITVAHTLLTTYTYYLRLATCYLRACHPGKDRRGRAADRA